MSKVVVTGAGGFIAGYLIPELLGRGYEVVGLDNGSKYGAVERSFHQDERFRMVEGDAKDVALLRSLLRGADHLIAGAAMIGGISYFHALAYDLLAENERITASTFDAALAAHREDRLKKITVIGSSMVFERASSFPTSEQDLAACPPPDSAYGFQKLACEYFARAAHQQYGLPYTICRPFNCVGVGERRALTGQEVPSGNLKLAMSHVVPDLVQKMIRGQDPLHILGSGQQVRCYTYCGDVAFGVAETLERRAAHNEDFNLSTPTETTVLELAEAIWRKVHGGARPFACTHDPPYAHDVQRRVPDVSKARRMLGFEAKTTLSEMLDEVIPWVRTEVQQGRI